MQADFERGDTAPLKAVGTPSEVAHDRGHEPEQSASATPASPGSQERTRPTFPPPGQTQNPPGQTRGPAVAATAGMRQYSADPTQAHPPQPRSHGHPSTPPPTAQRSGNLPTGRLPVAPGGAPADERPSAGRRSPGREAPRRITPVGWLVRGLALLGVSVLSGVLWLALRPDSSGQDSAQVADKPPEGKYHFELLRREEGYHNCKSISTDDIAQYFAQHQCRQYTRALYTTTLPGGEQVLTSVVTTKMPDAATAAQLEKLTTKSGTGNIEDLVSAGRPVPEDFPELDHDYGYASQQQGTLVVIGESSYFRTPERDDALLKQVTTDALRLGWPQDKAPK